MGLSWTDFNCHSNICPGQHLSWWHLSISGISQLLLTRFWPNFKGRFLGLSWTDFNYHSIICPCNICPGNICPGNICPYQEYLSCYWPDFDESLKIGSWDYLELISTVTVTFVQATFVIATFVHIKNISAVTDLILTKLGGRLARSRHGQGKVWTKQGQGNVKIGSRQG